VDFFCLNDPIIFVSIRGVVVVKVVTGWSGKPRVTNYHMIYNGQVEEEYGVPNRNHHLQNKDL